MAYQPEELNELVFLGEQEAPAMSPGSEGQIIPETSGTYYEERRETITDCLLATAVLLAILVGFLMLALVALGRRYEVHTFGIDELGSDSPGIVVPLVLDESIETTLPSTVLTSSSTTLSTAPSTTTTVTLATATAKTSTTISPTLATATAKTSTTISPTSSTAASMTTSTEVPRKLVLAGVLLCTLRASLSIRPYVYPDDGVCAIIMFNSLFIPEGSTLAPPYKSDFAHFMDAASHHSKTEYGFGIDHRFCRNETLISSLVAERATKTSLDEMWSHRVYHYGQVNTPPILTGFDTFQYVTQSAKGLQMISQLMKNKADLEHHSSYSVLHYPLMYDSMAADIAKALM